MGKGKKYICVLLDYSEQSEVNILYYPLNHQILVQKASVFDESVHIHFTVSHGQFIQTPIVQYPSHPIVLYGVEVGGPSLGPQIQPQ